MHLRPLYLITLIFWSLTYLAILPPFEGFDEPAHYSSIRQIADTGTIPLFGSSYLSENFINYAGPRFYESNQPPFDSGVVYGKFFADPKLVSRYQIERQLPRSEPIFRPSAAPNWQGQHPPLYYILMAPAARLLSHVSLETEIFILRLLSLAFALSGVLLASAAFTCASGAEREAVRVGFLIYPFLLPMFFFEFARIGNDSLCLLLTGAIAVVTNSACRNDTNFLRWFCIGVLLGLGLLTKALFIPVYAAFCLFLFVKIAFEPRRANIVRFLTVALPGLVLAGGWYAYKYIAYGSLSGSGEAIALAAQGGLLNGLERNFSMFYLARSLIVTFATWSWAGTWSLVHLPAVLQVPLLVMLAVCVASSMVAIRSRAEGDRLGVIIVMAFIAGLGWHTLVSLALYGRSNTPGWYVHILLPWTAPILGLGLLQFVRSLKASTWPIALVLGYGTFFQLAALWYQATLFAGCSIKGNDKSYLFTEPYLCLNAVGTVFSRLSLIASPSLAISTLLLALVCSAFLVRLFFSERHSAKLAHSIQRQPHAVKSSLDI
jgi:hypothetical protein